MSELLWGLGGACVTALCFAIWRSIHTSDAPLGTIQSEVADAADVDVAKTASVLKAVRERPEYLRALLMMRRPKS